MDAKGVVTGTDRRRLLGEMLPAGAFACLLCGRGLAAAGGPGRAAEPLAARSRAGCGMSWEELFEFAYTYDFIPAMVAMAGEVGREKLVETLSRAYSTVAAEHACERLRKDPRDDIAAYTEDMRKPGPLYQNAMTFTLVEDTPGAVEARVTECLWARTFRGAGAADIGYACLCHSEFAAVHAFNPRIRLSFTKTLMQGHDCCNPRYVMES